MSMLGVFVCHAVDIRSLTLLDCVYAVCAKGNECLCVSLCVSVCVSLCVCARADRLNACCHGACELAMRVGVAHGYAPLGQGLG